MQELVLLKDDAWEKMPKSLHISGLAMKAIREEVEHLVQREEVLLKDLDIHDLYHLENVLLVTFMGERLEALMETPEKAKVCNLYIYIYIYIY